LQAHSLDQVELTFERVDMLFLIFEDIAEQVPTHIVANALGMRDRALELGNCLAFELEIRIQYLLDRLADPEPPEHLEIGKAFEEQDPVGQAIGMLHLVDRLLPFELGEPGNAPICEQPIVKPILIDRRQLVPQRLVEMLDDLFVALHCASPSGEEE
jgi:hypothetical protein